MYPTWNEFFALLQAATALRPEEAFGLKWQNIDRQKGQINICRGVVEGKETAGKNVGGMTQVAMHPALSLALKAWRRESLYHRDSDWAFASNKTMFFRHLLELQALTSPAMCLKVHTVLHGCGLDCGLKN